MARSVTARSLYEALRERLKLHWVAGGVGEERAILVEDLTLRPATVGYLNLIHPNKIQVLGIEERQYLERLEPAEFEATVSRMFDSAPIAIVFGDSLEVPAQILSRGKVVEDHICAPWALGCTTASGSPFPATPSTLAL